MAVDPVRLELLAYDGFPVEAVDIVHPIALLFAEDEIGQAELATARYLHFAVTEIEDGGDPTLADQAMALLDFWLEDQFGDEEFSEEFEVMIEEALALHDIGTEFGPDLPVMRRAIGAIMRRGMEA